MPNEVHQWIDNVEKMDVETPPYYELVDVIYQLQKTDTEAPVTEVVRRELNRKLGTKYSTKNVTEWLNLLVNLVPGCVSVDGKYVGVQASATIIKLRIHKAISEIPLDMQPMYNEIFSQSEGV